MALVLADRVNETTTTTGLGTLTLAGAVSGYQSFSVIGNANTTYYTIVGQTTTEWEVGLGTYTSSGTTLSRDTVLASSAGGTTKVTLSAGTKFVFCDYPAGRAVYLDTASNATIPGIALSNGTANGVAYLNASKVLTTGSALTFDGTNLILGANKVVVKNAVGDSQGLQVYQAASDLSSIFNYYNGGMAFGINNTEQMRLTSTGLGIGTSSFSSKLAVSAAKATVQVTSTTGTNGAYQAFTNTGGNFYTGLDSSTGGDFAAAYAGVMWHGGAYPLIFGTSNTEKMRLDTSGNLGIGTSSPGNKLTVNGTASAVGLLQVTGTPGASLGVLKAQAGSGATLGYNRSRLDLLSQAGTAGWSLYNYGDGGDLFAIAVYGGSDVLSVTQAGNVGIGTSSPSALLHIKAATNPVFRLQGATDSGYVDYNGTRLQLSAGGGDLYFVAGNAERMRLDSSGHLGIGAAPPSGVPLYVSNSGAYAWLNTTTSGYSNVTGFDNGVQRWAVGQSAFGGANGMQFFYGTTEGMRLDSSGNLLVGTTSTLANGRMSVYNSSTGNGIDARIVGSGTAYSVYTARVDNTANLLHTFFYGNYSTVVGSITTNGTVTVYNTTSDYRLKEFVAPVTNAGERIDALNPVEFDWKSDGSRARGFFAHEFQQVYASSVNGTKDAVDEDGNPVYQTMQASTSEVIADLVAEIKSLRVRLNALENK